MSKATAARWPELWLHQRGLCGVCGWLMADLNRVEVDHIVPESQGGTDDIDNLQATHGRCNRTKDHPADGMKHGTRYAYQVQECRCDECRAWQAERVRAQRQRRRERQDDDQ